MKTGQHPLPADELFAGGGEMGARMRAFDWGRSALGPVEHWPQSLRTSISICLNSRFAILVWWGPQLVKLYNDAYSVILGKKHPSALGAPGRSVWPEIWDTIEPMLSAVLERGEANWADDLLLFLERHGYLEECYFTFSYSPIRDESGGVGGVFTPVNETTDRVIGERRLRTLRDLAALSANSPKSADDVCNSAAQALSLNPQDIPFAGIYLLTAERSSATLAASTFSGSDSLVPPRIEFSAESGFRAQLLHGQSCHFALHSPDAGLKLPVLPMSVWGIPVEHAAAQPLCHPGSPEPVGFILAGLNPCKRLDAAYRSFLAQVAEQIASSIREAEAVARESLLRARAEAERQKLREIFMKTPAGIAIMDGPEHRFTFVNDRQLEISHRTSRAELLGKTFIEAFPELESQHYLEWLDRVYATGEPFAGKETPATLLLTSGEIVQVWVNFVFQPIRDQHGHIEGIFSHVIDITEQVEARIQIEDREQQFRNLADSIPQLAWMAQPDGSIFWYNHRWYDYTGTTLEQMQGWGWQSVHHPEFVDQVVERFRACLASGEPFEMTFPLRSREGEFRSFLTRAVPVRDTTGAVVRWFGTNTDVEAQRKTEEALRQSEKLAAVGRLAASIAHEINNPLEAVTNLVYLARNSATNPETRELLIAAEQELSRVAQITNQTLRFHRQQSAATITDVGEVLTSILALYRGRLSSGEVELKLDIAPRTTLLCYAGEIRQVLANLIGNALDAMPQGGLLRLSARPGTDWRSGEPGVRVTVADTGHGMSPAVRRRIYEPFFTTKGSTGTGLGLWVTAGIVDKHRGSLHVRSSIEPGHRGTVFTLVFPYRAAPTNTPEAHSPTLQLASRTPTTSPAL